VADEIKDQANDESQRVLRDAEARADLIVQKSQGRLEDVQREIDGLRIKRREVEEGVEGLVKSLQTTLTFLKDQDAKHRDDKVLLHRPKQADIPAPATAGAAAGTPVAETEKTASQG
jgi:vacuolar-type H+-ATPase subunit H